MGAGAGTPRNGERDIIVVLVRDLDVGGSHRDGLWLVSLVSRIVNMLRSQKPRDFGVED
jgi:hypothetical protein